MSEWYLYMVRCCDDSLYTGISTDVARRFEEHSGKGKSGSKILKGKRPLKLVFQTKIGDRSLALKVEIRVKKLPKAKKEMLVNGNMDIETIIRQVE